MTEIPEHLLKRSRERRAALGLGGETEGEPAAGSPGRRDAGDDITGGGRGAGRDRSGSPRARRPAPVGPPPPKPDTPVVAAYKSRRRMPFWAMGALSLLPLWGFMYVRSVTDQAAAASGPLGDRRRGVRELRVVPRRHRRRWRGVPVHQRRGAGDVPPHRGPAAVRLLRHRALQHRRCRRLRQPRSRGRPAPDRASVGRCRRGASRPTAS